MAQKTVSILGCGYLGLPLARVLKSQGYKVKGSTTQEEILPLLKAEGIDPYFIKVESELTGDRIKKFLTGNIMVLALPFKKSYDPPDLYFQQIQVVADELAFSPIDFVIFTSSTSVYPELNQVMKEGDHFKPTSPRAKTLLQIEELLLNSPNFKTTVLRLGGLYGGPRKLAQFQEKTPIEEGDKPVNLIHIDDAIQIVAKIIQNDIRGQIFNACSDDHSLKKDLYKKVAAELKLPPPKFAKDGGKYKIVSNEKLKKVLGYQFIHPSPLELDA